MVDLGAVSLSLDDFQFVMLVAIYRKLLHANQIRSCTAFLELPFQSQQQPDGSSSPPHGSK